MAGLTPLARRWLAAGIGGVAAVTAAAALIGPARAPLDPPTGATVTAPANPYPTLTPASPPLELPPTDTAAPSSDPPTAGPDPTEPSTPTERTHS